MKKDLLSKRMAKTARLRSMSAQTRAVQLERSEGLTAKLRPKEPERGMGKERLSAAAISLQAVAPPIRHWSPAASRTNPFKGTAKVSAGSSFHWLQQGRTGAGEMLGRTRRTG